MKLHLEVDVSQDELRQLQENSVERCFSTMFNDPDKNMRTEARRELRELKGTITKIWYAASSAALVKERTESCRASD